MPVSIPVLVLPESEGNIPRQFSQDHSCSPTITESLKSKEEDNRKEKGLEEEMSNLGLGKGGERKERDARVFGVKGEDESEKKGEKRDEEGEREQRERRGGAEERKEGVQGPQGEKK